jgi:hypothetical protein
MLIAQQWITNSLTLSTCFAIILGRQDQTRLQQDEPKHGILTATVCNDHRSKHAWSM